jgi:hypothetical protein
MERTKIVLITKSDVFGASFETQKVMAKMKVKLKFFVRFHETRNLGNLNASFGSK